MMFREEKIGINVLRIDENNPRLPIAINQQVAYRSNSTVI